MPRARSSAIKPFTAVSRPGSRQCAVRRALSAIGNRWDPLILEAALFEGLTRSSEIAERLQIPVHDLQSRLDEFARSGLVELRDGSSGGLHASFRLTQKGRELTPIMMALATWGDNWTWPADPLTGMTGDECAGSLDPFIRCNDCREAPEPSDMTAQYWAQRDRRGLSDDPFEDAHDGSRGDVATAQVYLMGAFAIQIGSGPIVTPPVGTQRILAYLALHERAVSRLSMAGTMWPKVSDVNAGGSLRSALTRIDGTTREVIDMASGGLRLAETVAVDFRQSQSLAHRLLGDTSSLDEADFGQAATTALSADLLPEWYDDWVITEAEDWRQLRTTALEAQAEWLTTAGRFADAAGAARAAMKAEPLRESAHACLVRVHLAEGNQSEAVRAYEHFEGVLQEELGLSPTSNMTELFEGLERG
jgi:DNA-binding SARP family transcriptional activator/DNA-binding HxlR family transcriptional regulator